MQGKGSHKMITHNMKPAFSMITAIFVIVIMAGILALVSSLSGKIVKETTAQYRKEQAALLAKSYTEFAILAIQGNQLSGANTCLRTITAKINSFDGSTKAFATDKGEGYRVEIKIQYIGLRPLVVNCNQITSGHGSLGHQTTPGFPTTSNDVSATIDVYVQYRDLGVIDSVATNSEAPWVTYHRRTLQKL